jgi:predicted aspartyl protease
MRTRIRTAALAASVLLAVAACGGGGTEAATTGAGSSGAHRHTVRMKVVHHGDATLALVPVTIHGKGPFAFLLDTGSSTSSIDRDVAQRLGLQKTGRTQTVRGVVSKTKVPLLRIDDWKLGNAPLGQDIVAAIKISTRAGSPVDGLLGSDELSDFGSVTVDYKDGQLRFTER